MSNAEIKYVQKVKLPNEQVYQIALWQTDLSSTTTDLNNLTGDFTNPTVVKYYTCTNTTNITHMPNNNITEFLLTVKILKYTSAQVFIVKQYFETNGATWIRFCVNGTWDDWVEDITENDLVICTEAEFNNMQTRSALLYFIKEASS